MPIDAVIFDLFGTLVEPYVRWPELISSFCRVLQTDPESFDRAWSATADGRDVGVLRTATEALRHSLDQLGVSASDELLAEASAFQMHNIRLSLSLVRPEMLQLVMSLKEAGYPIGLIS